MSITGPSFENLDKSKGLWRAAYVLIKKLDTVYHGGKAIKTVFSYEAYGHRLRLKELLQKLMFMDLSTNFRRTEELIWRKAFYEPYFLYKVYVKNNDQQDRVKLFENMLTVHILSAIGYYQSLILAFQSELGDAQPNNLCSWIPIALHIPLYCGVFFEFEEKHNPSVENKSAIIKLMHKCLTNIGDLFRYLIDFGDSNAKRLAYRYYKAAFYFDPLMGLPHNQLGILDVGRCYGLNAIFHYLRCLTSRSPFEGAKGNLITVLAKNELRYSTIIREKPSKSSRIRYASYFRPKDFRKTIMKFIYLIQQFLKPVESRDPATENIFHDILAELHSSLLLTDHLTVKSESITHSEHTNTKYLKTGEVHQEKPDRVEETSDQLTGPIFIRMLLISILTYEYIHQLKLEQDLSKPSGKKSDENSNIESHSPQEAESTSASTGLMTSEEEKVIQTDSSDNCSSAVANKCESSSGTAIPDLYEPLSFALSIGELYLTHVCRQIYCRLGQFMEDPKGKPNNSVCSDPSNLSENPNCNHIPSDQPLLSNVSSTEHPEAISELVNPDDELDDSGDIKCTRTNSHESMHSTTDNDEDDEGHTRLRFRRYSSDEDSEHEFVERGTDENDNDSDTDFWGSDDSSLLHSQDEINSTGTPSDDDLDILSDDRLRRASKLNRMGSQRDAKQLKTNDSSKYLPESRSVSKDVRSTLTCISEEEAIQEGKTEKVEVPSLVSQSSSDNAKESVHHDSTVDSVEKNICHSSKCHSDSIKENLSDYPSVQFDKNSYDSNTDITTRISLFSRLYLFSAVKLFLDWLSSSQFQHLNLSFFQNINSTLTDNTINKSQKPSRASIIWQASVEKFVSQLIPLLNSIHPIFDQMSHEILCKNVTNTSKSCEISHFDENEQLRVDSCTHLTESNTDDKTKFNIVHHLSHDVYRTIEKLFSQQIPNSNKFPVEEQNGSGKNLTKETIIHNDEKSKIYPLPEDWLLLGLPSMNCIHEKIDFHNGCISPSLNEIDETVLRCTSLTFHGCSLASYSGQLSLYVTHNSTGNGHRPFKCDIPLTNVACLSSSNNSNWQHSSRRRRRGRRYQFYPGYGTCDRYSSSCPNTGYQHNRTDPRNTCVPHRGHSYREHARYSGSAKGHKSYYDSRHRNRHSQQADHHHNDWDTIESVQHLEVSQSDVPQSVSKSNAQRSDSSSVVKCDTELSDKPQINSTETDQSRRDQAMRDMARLRLLNEVDQLERQFRNQSPLSSTKRSTSTESSMQNSDSNIQNKNLEFDINKSFLSPFLVIDAYCLTSHLPMVKQLVSSNRFILIIPQAVISHLDYLKKTMASARVAIRYLEHEAHGGNRYLRLQKPDEQPNRPIELHRQDAVHNDAQDLITDTEEEEPKVSTNQSLNLRVVRRWVNILDCASYFAQTLKDSNKSSDLTSVNKNSLLKQATSSDEQDINDLLYSLNISPPYVDLLNKECITNELNELSLTKTAPVTILIGFRNTSIDDTIVPQDFLKLALNHGVRLESIRSFIQRWKAIKT
ncbi:unnamed protein product [Schistosoma rodhaini]|uniref:PIN domain-containing protein n=2 Tax=Schistosoma rodhaini TaxID=6188 RepID=A0AA85G2F0_9TREM|nr:unnamed protein product [Schistosoma rodhaini]CAH8595485.1 unnamed protein product [Schistosoma rodhaini]